MGSKHAHELVILIDVFIRMIPKLFAYKVGWIPVEGCLYDAFK